MDKVLSIFLLVLFGGCMTMNDPVNELAGLQGEWRPTEAVMGGSAMPETVLEGMSMTIEGNGYLVTIAGTSDRGTLDINENTNPPRMTINGVEGPNAGASLRAIYVLDGDTLNIAYNIGGSDFPEDFESVPGTQNFVARYVRQ